MKEAEKVFDFFLVYKTEWLFIYMALVIPSKPKKKRINGYGLKDHKTNALI